MNTEEKSLKDQIKDKEHSVSFWRDELSAVKKKLNELIQREHRAMERVNFFNKQLDDLLKQQQEEVSKTITGHVLSTFTGNKNLKETIEKLKKLL